MSTNERETEEMDEAEEEALLKSDDEYEKIKASHIHLFPPPVLNDDEDSLMKEAAELDAMEKAKNESDLSDEEEDEDRDSSDDDDDELEAQVDKVLLEYRDILKELEQNQFAYDKYVRLCEISQ